MKEILRDLVPPVLWRTGAALTKRLRLKHSSTLLAPLHQLKLYGEDAIAFVPLRMLQTYLFYYEQMKALQSVPGDIVEFGVHRGSTLTFFARCIDLLESPESSRHLIGFDTFQGFPETNRMSESNSVTDRRFQNLFRDTSVDLVRLKLDGCRVRSKLIAGDIYQTLPRHLEEWPNKIAMAICDVDAGEITTFILNHIWGRMAPGGRIYFDEYSREGWSETIGVDRFLKDRRLQVSVLHPAWKPSGMIEVPKET
jgi:hypothetical protein